MKRCLINLIDIFYECKSCRQGQTIQQKGGLTWMQASRRYARSYYHTQGQREGSRTQVYFRLLSLVI